MKRYLTILLILAILIPAFSYSQRSSRWKRTRYELIAGTGTTNFLGELGGSDKAGANFFSDFEISTSRPLLHAAFRYKILEPLAGKVALSYGWVEGSDEKTNNIYRKNRNLKFYSPIIEFGGQLEYSLIKEKVGKRYNMRKTRGLQQLLRVNTYIFAGFAGFWFNPKGKDSTGTWQALQPLGTEGQGLVPTRPLYSRISVAIPLGIGFKYGITRKLSIGLEYGMRYTFTDYIDDVSTTYYDNNMLRTAKGDIAAYLADPSLGELSGQTVPNQQRGNPRDNDSYMFTIITVSYKLNTGRNGLPKF
ncbi:MAG: hypothetical protein GXO79_15310 [Chlorobi bacterium]|nr:hypothetical protein [Chlorobiota bacterium]